MTPQTQNRKQYKMMNDARMNTNISNIFKNIDYYTR